MEHYRIIEQRIRRYDVPAYGRLYPRVSVASSELLMPSMLADVWKGAHPTVVQIYGALCVSAMCDPPRLRTTFRGPKGHHACGSNAISHKDTSRSNFHRFR